MSETVPVYLPRKGRCPFYLVGGDGTLFICCRKERHEFGERDQPLVHRMRSNGRVTGVRP